MTNDIVTRMTRICRYFALSILLTAILSCGRREREEQPPAQQMERRIDHLRSLPYVGGTTAPQDDSTGVVFFDKKLTCHGYRLYTVAMLGQAELIDETGNVLKSWHYQPNDRWIRAELLPNGDLLVIGAEGYGWKKGEPTDYQIADSARYVVRLDWSSRLLWKRKLFAHHDVELTPSGKLLLLTFKRQMDPSIHPTVMTRVDHLTLLEQDGTLLKSKSLLDAIRKDLAFFPMRPVGPTQLGGASWVDLLHSNSIEWMHHDHLFSKHLIYDPNNVLVCFRHQDRVAIFNWLENKVIWSWGLNLISGPHDAQVLENGNMLLFDNGISRGWSRAIEIDPLSGEIVWEYRGEPPSSFFTLGRGSAQRLPNNNTLLAESDRGRAIEVTPAGRVVWEFINPYRGEQGQRAAIVRMIWHSPEFVETILALHE
jgi:hypothetical protein